MLLVLGFVILANLVSIGTLNASDNIGKQTLLIQSIISLVFSMVMMTVIAVLIRALWGILWAVFCCLLFLPLNVIGLSGIYMLILIILTSSRASKFLSKNGVKVGFLGPSPDTIKQLRARAATT